MVLDGQRARVDFALTPVAKRLINVNPNMVSWAGLLLALLCGVIFYFSADRDWLLIVGAVMVLVSGYFDALDGKIAKLAGKAGRKGDYLDHVFDRYADVFMIGGVAFSAWCNPYLGMLALIGVLITAAMHIKNVKGSILIGIVATWVLGIICQLVGLYTPNAEAGFYSMIPSQIVSADFSKLGETFGQCFRVDFSSVKIMDFVVVVFAFLFVDLFDTLGTLIGVATKANMLDKEGRLPGIKPALLADAIGTTVGAVCGTSTITTFVESAAGVSTGGRTGLTALVAGLLFLISTLFAPLFTSIPSFATAPALIMVGFLMVSSVTEIRFDDDNLGEAIPAYIAIIAMPLFYSISEGISLGIISYVILNVLTGKGKKVSPLMYILAALFVLKYIFL